MIAKPTPKPKVRKPLKSKPHGIPPQLRGWVTVSTPGAGHQREGVISFDLREFAAWFGKGVAD